MSLVGRPACGEEPWDEQRSRVPEDLYDGVGECWQVDMPFVFANPHRDAPRDIRIRATRHAWVNPRRPGSMPYINHACEDLEQHYGAGLRATPEYQGLATRQLHTLLGRRQAVSLFYDTWVSLPITGYSREQLGHWMREYGGQWQKSQPPATTRTVRAVQELEDVCGHHLRRCRALGFRGTQLMHCALMQGIRVHRQVCLNWVACQGQWTTKTVMAVSEGVEEAPPRLRQSELGCRMEAHILGLRLGQGKSCASVARLASGASGCVTVDLVQRLGQRRGEEAPAVCWPALLHGRALAALRAVKQGWDDAPFAGVTKAERQKYFDRPCPVAVMHAYERPEVQGFFVQRLQQAYGVLVSFPAKELQNVWQFVMPQTSAFGARLPCRDCGYHFSEDVCVLAGAKAQSPCTEKWVCSACLEDEGLARVAMTQSFRTKRYRPPGDRRCRPKNTRSTVSTVSRNNEVSMRQLRKSMAALFARRQASVSLGLEPGMTPHGDWGVPDHAIHDELLYAHGYKVPKPDAVRKRQQEVSAYIAGARAQQAMPAPQCVKRRRLNGKQTVPRHTGQDM